MREAIIFEIQFMYVSENYHLTKPYVSFNVTAHSLKLRKKQVTIYKKSMSSTIISFTQPQTSWCIFHFSNLQCIDFCDQVDSVQVNVNTTLKRKHYSSVWHGCTP